MAFSEFYTDFTNGSNLNAGSTNTAAVYTSAGGDSDGTSVFTPNDGSTPASTVSVGMFGSVYVTAGATVAVFVGRVTIVAAGVNGAITFSTTAKSGTFPAASAGAHTITLKVGGYWKGPNAASGFPFGFITAALTNVAGDVNRVNLVATGTYSVTAAITHSTAGPTKFQGCTASAGDGGRATIDGGGTGAGAAYALLTISGAQVELEDVILQGNGKTSPGNATSLLTISGNAIARRVIANNSAVHGFLVGANGTCIECEAYNCGVNSAASGGFSHNDRGARYLRCYSHDHGNTTSGFSFSTNISALFADCIADTCAGSGWSMPSAAGMIHLVNCDAYNCTSDGVTVSGSSNVAVYIENCNLVKNGGYGINLSTTGSKIGYILNCGFGSGTQVNTSGQTNSLGSVEVSGSVTYAANVTPWNAPTTGDFRIILPQAQYAGRGAFTQTDGTNTGTVAYPDIGAAQHVQAPIGLTTGARAMTTY